MAKPRKPVAPKAAPRLTPVRPTKPVAPYIGGKRNLAATLIDRIAATPHSTYVEPFVGMGGVFLRRPFRAQCEIINDLSADIVTLFRVLQRHDRALMDMLKWQLASRAEWDRLLAQAPDTLTDLERAARFLYLQRLSFGGKIRSPQFGVATERPSRFDVTRLGSMLEDVHERLAGVTIERLPYGELIPRYDRPSTLFYMDPPYHGSETYYGPGLFSAADFEVLAGLLADLKGRFILSLNDVPEVRRIFGGFKIERVGVSYAVGLASAARREFGEVIITGGKGL